MCNGLASVRLSRRSTTATTAGGFAAVRPATKEAQHRLVHDVTDALYLELHATQKAVAFSVFFETVQRQTDVAHDDLRNMQYGTQSADVRALIVTS